jgi:hypothetical protein
MVRRFAMASYFNMFERPHQILQGRIGIALLGQNVHPMLHYAAREASPTERQPQRSQRGRAEAVSVRFS